MTTDDMRPAAEDFVVERDFDAAPELVWKVNTELEHLQQWWGPAGFSWIGGSLDLRPGGMFHYGMRNPGGHEMWGRFVYRTIEPITRLEYVVSFSDAEGGITRAPMSGSWPLEVLSDNRFTPLGSGTRLTMRGRPLNASPEEEAAYAAFHDNMRKGFAGTLDALDNYLARLKREQ
ncbi:SRPBCC domain-containing protein [bacterium]|nr:SRPBCC domain-containing protein [bacterium]